MQNVNKILTEKCPTWNENRDINMMPFDNSFEDLTCIYSITFPEMNTGEAVLQYNSQNNLIVFHIQIHRKTHIIPQEFPL